MTSPHRLKRPSSRGASLYDLVGAREQRLRHIDPERLRGFQIDYQLELGRLLDGEIGWLSTGEYPAHRRSNLEISIREARSVADQTACRGELAPLINRWDGMARR